jgi:hypothetical protein
MLILTVSTGFHCPCTRHSSILNLRLWVDILLRHSARMLKSLCSSRMHKGFSMILTRPHVTSSLQKWVYINCTTSWCVSSGTTWIVNVGKVPPADLLQTSEFSQCSRKKDEPRSWPVFLLADTTQCLTLNNLSKALIYFSLLCSNVLCRVDLFGHVQTLLKVAEWLRYELLTVVTLHLQYVGHAYWLAVSQQLTFKWVFCWRLQIVTCTWLVQTTMRVSK